MASKRTTIIASVAAVGLFGAALAAPAFAGESRASLDTQRLDKTQADYTQYRYRRGWNGGRTAAVAGAVGLGVLGAAAIAANRGAYAEPVYDYGPGYGYAPGYAYEPGYAYGSYAPAYSAPVEVYQPPRQRYYGGRGPYADTYRGAPDPARGGK